MYSRSRIFVLLAVIALAAVSCARDPEVEKRQFVIDGDEDVKQAKYADAIVRYSNAIRVDDKFGEARVKLAAAYEAAGDYRNALRHAVRGADLRPDDPDAQLQAAKLLLGA